MIGRLIWNLAPALANAAAIVRQARSEGKPVELYVKQNTLDGETMPDSTINALRLMFKDEHFSQPRGGAALNALLNTYSQSALRSAQAQDMFSESATPQATLQQLIAPANPVSQNLDGTANENEAGKLNSFAENGNEGGIPPSLINQPVSASAPGATLPATQDTTHEQIPTMLGGPLGEPSDPGAGAGPTRHAAGLAKPAPGLSENTVGDTQGSLFDSLNRDAVKLDENGQAIGKPQSNGLEGNGLSLNADSTISNLSSNGQTIPKFAFAPGAKTTGKIERPAHLVDIALSRQDGNKAFTEIGPVTQDVADKVKQAIGEDVSGWMHSIDEAAIRHVFEKHGNVEIEAKRGQIAVTREDIEKLIEVVNVPDQIKQGDEANTIEVSKKIGSEIFVVQEVRAGRGKLALKTMWKKPLAARDAPLKESPAEASETFGKQASNESIAQPAPKASRANAVNTTSYSKATLQLALRGTLDKAFGKGFTDSLLATRKFKIVSREEAGNLPGNTASNNGASAQAFYNPADQTTYFIHDAIGKQDDLYGLALHEIGVHALQLGKDNEGFKAVLDHLEAMRKAGHAAVKEAFARVPAGTHPDHITEEALAYLVQHHPKLSTVQKLLAWFRDAIRSIGQTLPVMERLQWVRWANHLTEQDLTFMAERALRSAPDKLGKVDNTLDKVVKHSEQDTRAEKLIKQYASLKSAPSKSEILEANAQYRRVEAQYFNADGSKKPGAMLAPNGKATHLNKEQWILVRTPNFKRWFGDWEIANANPTRQATTFDEAREAIKDVQGKPIVNLMTGMSATLSRNNLDKMLNSKAVGKSESPAGHALAVANLDTLFKRAILGWSKPDRDADINLLAVHRFFAPLNVNGKARLVKLTVKEFAREDQGNKVYSVESVELDENTPAAQWVDSTAQDDGLSPTSIRSAGDVLSLAQRVQDFNLGFVSKVTDENGEPLVVYHGSDFASKINEFKKGAQRIPGENGFFGSSPRAWGT